MLSQTESSTKNLQKIMIISTFGGLLFGYDTGVINGALPYMSAADQLNLTPLREGMVVSGLLLGAAIGAISAGRLSDKYGRKTIIFCLSILFIISTLGCSFAPSFEVMVCSRFLLGLAVGGASVIVPVYLAEISPSNKRGRMVIQNDIMIVVGQLLAFVFNAIIAVSLAGNSHLWRFMLAMAAIPAVVLFFGMMKMPESPRWLVTKGQTSKALEILNKIRHSQDSAKEELNDIQQTIVKEKNEKQATLKDLTIPWIRKIIIIGIGIGVFSQLTGINAIMYYGTHVLNQSGFDMQAALIANTLNGVTSVVATTFCIFLVKKFRRRSMLLIGYTGIAISLSLVVISSMFLSGTPMFPYIILCLIVLFLAFSQGFVCPLTWLILPEIIPLRFRGSGMGCCILIFWIVNFMIGLLFPVLVSSVGMEFTFSIFVVVSLIALVFVKYFVPETKGSTLEEIENRFHKVEHKILKESLTK